jgi:hypothetical protein
MEHVLLTFPRTGSHYLQQLIYQKTDLFIEKTHHISEVNNRFIISVVRSPDQTFRSLATMNKHFSSNKDIGVGLPLEDYVSFHKYLIDNSAILIDYEDLVSAPDKVVKAVAKRLNLEVNDMEYQDVLVDQPHYQHLVSSRMSEEYDKIDLSKFDLFACNMIYADALLECISI